MAQLFIATALTSLLQLWEDQNRVAELFFEQTNFLKTMGVPLVDPAEKKVAPLIGSEVNIQGLLGRHIPEYQKLRNILTGTTSFAHPTNFLPRVPKEYREKATVESFSQHRLLNPSLNVPTFLLKWAETRRACVVEDSVPVPRLDLRQENWLGKLPYPSFYLQLKSPFIIQENVNHPEITIQDFMVYDDGDYIRLLFWRKENEDDCLEGHEKDIVLKAIQEYKTGKKRSTITQESRSAPETYYRKLSKVKVCELKISKTETCIVESRTQKFIESKIDIYEPDNITSDIDREFHVWHVNIIETLNGFCKLTANLPPGKGGSGEESLSNPISFSPPRQWFELPVQTVQHYHTDTIDSKIVLVRGTSSEMSPHYRRGHYRRLVQKDGSEKLIWVSDTIVREDKLETQLIQSGVLKIK